MSENNLFFLPLEIVNLFDFEKSEDSQNACKLIKVKFHIYAWTDEDDYRCRSLDDYEMSIETDLSKLDYSVKSEIESYINCNFTADCPSGKHPEFNLTGALVESYTDYDTDRGKGTTSLDGYVWVYIP